MTRNNLNQITPGLMCHSCAHCHAVRDIPEIKSHCDKLDLYFTGVPTPAGVCYVRGQQ